MSLFSTATPLPYIDADEVDKRLADGWTLPATLYTHPAVQELEYEIAWKRGWHVVCTMADLKKPGAFVKAYLANRYPIIVTLNGDREVRALVNVCKHRGCLVVGGERGDDPEDDSGQTRRFTCSYHAWTYDLNGALVAIPERGDAPLPPMEELGLDKLSVGIWGGAVFVSMQPDEPFDEFISGMDEVARDHNYRFPFLDESYEYLGSYTTEIASNWKIYLENNLECYHCGSIHSDTLGAICTTDVDGFHVVDFKNGHYFRGQFTDQLEPAVGDVIAERMRKIVAETGDAPQQQYWLWPGTFITTGVLFGDAIFRIDPIDANRCRLVGRSYGHPDEQDDVMVSMAEYFSSIVDEDLGVSAGTQIGLRAGTREYGPMLGKREQGVNQSSKVIWERLAPAFRTAKSL